MPPINNIPFDLGPANVRINVRLDNFHFFHRPITGALDEEEDGKYIERSNPIHQLYNWIRYNEADSGSYLVTGYRGAGKSSFVGQLIKKLREDQKKSRLDYITLSVNLGQENIEEIEILRIIAKRLHGELLKRHQREYYKYRGRCNWIYTTLLLAVVCLGLAIWHLPEPSFKYYGYSFFLFFWLYSYFKIQGKSTVVRAINKLKILTERLHASVQEEMTQNIGLNWEGVLKTFSLQHKKTRGLPPATVQEIEYDLIEVLDLLKEHNKYLKIIIIFDELDKADSGKRREQSEDLPEFEKLSVRPEQKVSSRTRKQEVLRMIANMKFFLSSAKAYFIFIAGREMYEAYLADMSDRDFSLSSIFSGVLNIDSFLTSSRNTNNSNRMTEQFVCKQILPADIENIIMQENGDNGYDRNNFYSLKNCYYYWRQHPTDFYGDELTAGGKPDFDRRDKRLWRDVKYLYHFVNYLTYISNGSPKKLTLFFEKNVRRNAYLLEKEKIKPLYRYEAGKLTPQNRQEGMSKDVFYLSFGYYAQMKVNFIHYLTYPIMQTIISRSNQYGDKLLVSSSFLISHIFKLHNCAFSWRNLEQTPELLEINKTPEIREYIGSIIDFMNHTHLTTIICGLFHYKFPMRLAEEISFHSKISGEISAIFNFSLDEMQSIKNHYVRLLKNGDGREQRITNYSYASIHHSLGDIYMQEENYSDAIREYEKCMEIVSPMLSDAETNKKTTNFQLLNYLSFLNRTILKMGLAHEKRRTDNSAFIIYEELIRILNKFNGEEYGNVLFDNMRTFHLALPAKLYVLEKIDTMGICASHLSTTCELFDELFGKADSKNENKFVRADFYRKLGDILFVKNRGLAEANEEVVNAKSLYRKGLCTLLGDEPYNKEQDNEDNICKALCERALAIKDRVKECNSSINQNEATRDNYIYHMAVCLEDLGHVALSEWEDGFTFDREFLQGLRDALKYRRDNKCVKLNFNSKNNVERAILYYWTAARLYNASCERGLSTNAYREVLYSLLTYVRRISREEYETVDVFLVLDLAREVAQHFLISQYRQYEYIHMEELDMLRWVKGAEIYRYVELGDSSISSDMEELISIFYTLQLRLYKIAPNNEGEEPVSGLSRFYHSDIMTGRHTCSTLTSTVLNRKVKAKFDEQLLVSLFDCGSPDELELLQLTDVAKVVYGKVTDRLVRSFFQNKSLDDPDGKLDLLESLIIEGMFCLSQIAELVIPLRNSTLFNHSFKADIYVHLLRFNYLYRLLYSYYGYGINPRGDRVTDRFLSSRVKFRSFRPREDSVDAPFILQNLKHTADMTARRQNFLSKIKAALRKSCPTRTHLYFLAENAIHYYTKARQVHSEGKSYQELIRNLFFLEDDLNNGTLQFYLALERFDIASQVQHSLEEQLKERYLDNPLYEIGNYFASRDGEEASGAF